jgi:hypothetical protein
MGLHEILAENVSILIFRLSTFSRMSMREYGLDCQSRHSKSRVVYDGSLSTEVLRVVIWYRRTRSELFRFDLEVKEMVSGTIEVFGLLQNY